jgi:deoxyadenosine/deoxycytidine kinase
MVQTEDQCMLETKVIILEGIMGSGKSTTGSFLATQLGIHGIPSQFIWEGTHPHPVRLLADLPHPFAPWQDLTTEAYIQRSLTRWQSFVATATQNAAITIFDGQLFHGDMTNLFMMDTTVERLFQYTASIVNLLGPLHPTLIYFYQADLDQALQGVFQARGTEWEQYQVNWKTRSPYCVQRSLHGYPGLVAMYHAYRAVTDHCFSQLNLPKLALDTSAGDWSAYSTQVLGFLNLPLEPARS